MLQVYQTGSDHAMRHENVLNVTTAVLLKAEGGWQKCFSQMPEPKTDSASVTCKFGGTDAASGDGVINCRFGHRAATVI